MFTLPKAKYPKEFYAVRGNKQFINQNLGVLSL